MLHSLVLAFTLQLSDGAGPQVDELRVQAETRIKERAYAEAGELYMTLAALPNVDRRKELLNAHTNFEAAYLTSHEPRHLCRALGVAELVVRENGFQDEQMGQFWRERIDEDLDRLRQDALVTKRPNCRFGAAGKPRAIVPLLADSDFPPPQWNMSQRPASVQDSVPPTTRRDRAHTATGAVFTGLGIGFLGLFAGALAVEVDQVQAIRRQTELVQGQGRIPTPDEQTWVNDRASHALQAQNLAIGAGTAGVISFATGVALLATRKRPARPLALRPFGGAQGAGLLLRGRF